NLLESQSPALTTEQAALVRPVYKPNYTINDLTELHGFSRSTIIRLYEKEDGVQVLANPRNGVRRYRTFSVPHHVYERVRLRLERGITPDALQKLIDERVARDEQALEALHRRRIEAVRAARRSKKQAVQ